MSMDQGLSLLRGNKIWRYHQDLQVDTRQRIWSGEKNWKNGMNEVPDNQWAYKKYNLVTIYKLEITSCTIEMVS